MFSLNKFYLVLTLGFFTLLINDNAVAQMTMLQSGKMKFELFTGIGASTSIYNDNGNPSSNLISNDSLFYFESENIIIGFKYDYAISDYFNTYIELPFCYSTLLEKFPLDSLGNQRKRHDLSFFRLMYLGIGGKLRVLDGFVPISLIANLKVPVKDYTTTNYDPEIPYWGTERFELKSGAEIGLKLEKGWIQAGAYYNLRSKGLKNEFIAKLEGALATVQGTELYGSLNYCSSLSKFPDTLFTDPQYMQNQKELFDVGVGFNIFITNSVQADASYRVSLIGKGTYSAGMFLVKLAYIF